MTMTKLETSNDKNVLPNFSCFSFWDGGDKMTIVVLGKVYLFCYGRSFDITVSATKSEIEGLP